MQMIQTLIRNLVKRPATRKYPLVKRDPFENYRGRLVNHVQSCIFCRMCSTKCPAQCISTDPKEAYWGYDPFSCVYCGICVEVCPTKSLFMLSTHRSPVPDKFVVYHKGQARVARPRLAAMPKVAPSEIHAETPPPSVIAAAKITSEQEEAASPVSAARPAPVPPAKRKTEEAEAAPAPQPAPSLPENTLGLSSEAIVHVPVSAPLEGVEVASVAGGAAPDQNTTPNAAAPEPAAPTPEPAPEPAAPAEAASEPAKTAQAEPAAPATTSEAPSEAKAAPSAEHTAAAKTAPKTESAKRGRKSGGKGGKKSA